MGYSPTINSLRTGTCLIEFDVVGFGGWLGRWCYGTQFSRFCTTVFWCFLCNHFRLMFRTLKKWSPGFVLDSIYSIFAGPYYGGVFSGMGMGLFPPSGSPLCWTTCRWAKKSGSRVLEAASIQNPGMLNSGFFELLDISPTTKIVGIFAHLEMSIGSERSRIFWCLRGQWSSSWCPSW